MPSIGHSRPDSCIYCPLKIGICGNDNWVAKAGGHLDTSVVTIEFDSGAIAVAERQSYIGRIRDLCKACATEWVEQERGRA